MKNIELIDKAIDQLIDWPSSEPEETHLYQFDSGRFVAGISGGSTPAPFCTRAEFLARKAERQNKPDWSECHDWAMFMVQDQDGFWYVTSQKPIAKDLGWEPSFGKWAASDLKGEVIGRWQDTLEQRPAVTKAPALNIKFEAGEISFTETLPGVEDREFMTIGAAESDWHARGELPPSGIYCEFECFGDWTSCFVVGKSMYGDMVLQQGDGSMFNTAASAVFFRPLRTEREKFIEAASKVLSVPSINNNIDASFTLRLAAEALFDAGFRQPDAKA